MWAQAIEILKHLVETMDSPLEGLVWLGRLEKTECKDAHRLGFCVAIDLACGALNDADLTLVLNKIDNGYDCPRKAFAKAYAEIARDESLICRSRLDMPSPRLGPYIRVLTLKDFITYYRKDRTLAPDDVAAVRADHFTTDVPSDLMDIREWWSGANNIVWVMSRHEFEALKSGRSGDDLATLLNDALGLGKEPKRTENDGRELVGVSYPDDFDLAKQPTSFDAHWANFGWYYVSYGREDGWGQTVSCSGTREPVRERVHQGFEGLSSGFLGFPIGDILDLKIDREALLLNAERRLHLILTATASGGGVSPSS